MIDVINASSSRVISVDIPSGMPANGIRDFAPWKNTSIIRASRTYTFQFPKPAFFLMETGPFVGDWKVLDIGLNKEFIEEKKTPFVFLEAYDLQGYVKKRAVFSHKGNYGHLLISGGIDGKSGAVLLASKAALRTGCGKLTLCSVPKTIASLSVYLPEAMTFDAGNNLTGNFPALNDYNAIVIGPGLGKDEHAAKFLKRMLQDWQGPLLIDADGLNILAENPTWMNWLPKGTVLTPHPLELRRLTGNSSGTHFELIQSSILMAKKYSVYINLKGTYSCLITPSGSVLFNSSGTPGLSKAGTGDVLAGMIGGLLSMGYSSTEAVCLGNYLHGRAASLCLLKNSPHCLLAGEIQEFIGQAMLEIEN